MLQYFRLKRQPERVVPDLGAVSFSLLERDPSIPLTIRQLNNLPDAGRPGFYLCLIPRVLLTWFGIDSISWTGPGEQPLVRLRAKLESDKVTIIAPRSPDPNGECLTTELAVNALNGMFFIPQSVDRVGSRVTEDGTTMVMTKHLPTPTGGAV